MSQHSLALPPPLLCASSIAGWAVDRYAEGAAAAWAVDDADGWDEVCGVGNKDVRGGCCGIAWRGLLTGCSARSTFWGEDASDRETRQPIHTGRVVLECETGAAAVVAVKMKEKVVLNYVAVCVWRV